MLENIALKEVLYEKLLNAGETALTVAKFPASGSFIDVKDALRFGFKIYAGALDTAVVAQVEAANAVDGTPADIAGATVTIGATGDNNVYGIEVHRDMLNDDQEFVTLDITGPTGNDYGAIVFWAVYDQLPVTQETATSITLLTPGQS